MEIYKTYGIKELSKITETPANRLRNAFKHNLIPNESGTRKYEASIDTYNKWKRGELKTKKGASLIDKFKQ